MIAPLGQLKLSIPSLSPGQDAASPASTGATGGVSFASLLGDTLGRVGQTLHQAETMSVQALQGKTDTREVVDAVMNAEQSFQAAVAIRDKIVSAYLEVSRMAI